MIIQKISSSSVLVLCQQIRWFISQGSPGMSLSNGEYPQNLHVEWKKMMRNHEIWGFFFGVPPWFLDTWQPWFFPWFVPQFQRFAWSMASLQDSAIFMALTRNRLKPTKASEVGLVWDRNFLHRLYLHESWHTSVGATGSKLKTWDEAEVALAPRDLDSFSKSQYPKKTTEVGFFAFGHRLQPCHPC